MKYYMPTTVLDDDDVVLKSGEVFKKLGTKALIVTGKSSAKKCGALDDVIKVLDEEGISHTIFDEVVENPPIAQNYDGAIKGKGCDFVIGIGGGSPMDTAKGIAILLKHGTDDYVEKLFGKVDYDSIPVVAIPTTSGTGSEVTPYSVFTDDVKKTKVSMARRIFPTYSLIDVKYFKTMPKNVRISTVIDALSHSIESYINTKSSPYSELYALRGIEIFGEHKELLDKEEISTDVQGDFVRASTYAGVAIAQTGTSLPHSLGYAITYNFGVPHGIANGMFLPEFLRVSPVDRRNTVLSALGFGSIDEFAVYLDKLVKLIAKDVSVTEEDMIAYTELLMENKAKLKCHPTEVTHEDILTIYKNTLK